MKSEHKYYEPFEKPEIIDPRDPIDIKPHKNENDGSPFDTHTNPLLRTIMTTSFLVAVGVVLITSVGLALMQTGVFDVHKVLCVNLTDKLNRTDITFDNVTHEKEGFTGGFVALTCHVPLAERDVSVCVIWKRRNNTIPRVDGVVSNGLSLHFKELKSLDGGEYYCVVCSNAQCTKGLGTTFNLSIKEKREPKDLNLDGPVDTIVRIGKDAYFFCFYDMKTPNKPNLTWYFLADNDHALSTEIVSTERSKTNQSIRVLAVNDSHEGSYTCQAKTIEGVKAVTAKLKVNDGWQQRKKQWTIALGVLDGLALAVIAIIILKLFFLLTIVPWYDRQKKNLTQSLIKMIVVEHVEEDGEKVPKIRMVTVKTKGEIVGDGYAFPDDQQFEVGRENIKLGKQLGSGNFGCVYQAEVRGLFTPEFNTIVAVKMLKDGYSDKDVMDLYNEKEVMKMIPKHEHVISLLGCCSSPDGPLMVIVECAVNGSLIDYLKDLRKPNAEGKVVQKTPKEVDLLIKQFLKFAYQIASGMEHLASVKCVHRDLAARNVLVDISYNMKISDFGLARDINRCDYYRRNGTAALPIHWMAPESLTDRKNHSYSDVWSYGVVLWEIFSLGLKPFPCVGYYQTLIDLLLRGERMEQPLMSPDVVYQVMLDCWTLEARKRPTFTKLVERFSEIIKTDDPNLLKPMSQTHMIDSHQKSPAKSRNTDRTTENVRFNKGYVLSEINAKPKAD